MSGDVQILFLYDILRCRREEDDPKDAILYFHPADYSVDRKIAICGQLMGVTHFCSDLFSMPTILNLQRGKFAIRPFGTRYVLALGCASFTPDCLLQDQIDLLCALIRMFHHDIEDILEACGDTVAFVTKLTHICDYYLPLSEYNGDLLSLGFGALPTLSGLKDTEYIDSRARELLQACRKISGVIGGQISCQSRVICSDLPQKVAQRFALLQAHEYPPAQFVGYETALPEGVVLFVVYLSESELQECSANIGRYIPFSNSTVISDISESDHAYDGEPSDTSYNASYSEFSSSAEVQKVGKSLPFIERIVEDTSEEIEPPAVPLYCKKVTHEPGRKSRSLDLQVLDHDREDDVALKRALLMACSLPETTFFQSVQADIRDGNRNEIYAFETSSAESRSRKETSDSSVELTATTTSSSNIRELQADGMRCWKAPTDSPSVTNSSQSSIATSSRELTERFNILRLRPSLESSSHSPATSLERYHKVIAYIQNSSSMRLTILMDIGELDFNSVQVAYDLGNTSLPELQTFIFQEEKRVSFDARPESSGHLRYQNGSKTLLRGGKSHSMDCSDIQSMHRDFSRVKGLSEVVIRNDGYILYGHRKFGAEEYSQESLSSVDSLRLSSTTPDRIDRPTSRTSKNKQRDFQLVMF